MPIVRLMAWNVWWRLGPLWRARDVSIHEVVRRVQPDLLGLAESWATADDSQAGLLAGQLGGFGAFERSSIPPVPEPVRSEEEGVEMGVGLVSRWPVLQVTAYRLPAAHREPPTALVAVVDHPRGALHTIVACTEWEVDLRDDHLAQMHALADLMADASRDGDLPVVLLGDLNAPPQSPEVAALAAVATDLWPLGGGEPDAVTLSSTTPFAPLEAVRQIDRRVDYVFARPGRPGLPLVASGSSLAGTSAINGTFPSDHFAVVVDLDDGLSGTGTR